MQKPLRKDHICLSITSCINLLRGTQWSQGTQLRILSIAWYRDFILSFWHFSQFSCNLHHLVTRGLSEENQWLKWKFRRKNRTHSSARHEKTCAFLLETCTLRIFCLKPEAGNEKKICPSTSLINALSKDIGWLIGSLHFADFLWTRCTLLFFDNITGDGAWHALG